LGLLRYPVATAGDTSHPASKPKSLSCHAKARGIKSAKKRGQALKRCVKPKPREEGEQERTRALSGHERERGWEVNAQSGSPHRPLGARGHAPSARAAVTIESFTTGPANTLAGAHADASTSFALRTLDVAGIGTLPLGGDPREIVVKLPSRGRRRPSERAEVPAVAVRYGVHFGERWRCPADTQVGVADLSVGLLEEVAQFVWGVYNVQPGPE